VQARLLAYRLLEADEDFDVRAELQRYTGTPHPGIEIESAYNHWAVFHVDSELGVTARFHIGSIYYDDMEDAPVEVMTPEARKYHEAHRWTACPIANDPTTHATFDNALEAIIPPAWKKRKKVGEGIDDPEDPEDIEGTIERTAASSNQPISMEIVSAGTGRPFRVKLVWDQPSAGRVFKDGKLAAPEIQPVVEFYDLIYTDWMKFHHAQGQFVSRYFAATLMERPTGGLDLCGGEPVWQIDAESMGQVRAWIKQEAEKRGYRLKNDLFGMKYESLDPDDPELYTNPDKFSQQPKYEQMESDLRVMLGKIYDTVHIHREPSRWARIFKGLPDYWKWTVHCKRETPLQLPKTRPYVGHRGPDPNSWRAQAETWFEDWALRAGVSMRTFTIYGRLRKDPVFQFETHLPWKAGTGLMSGKPIRENEEDITPEQVVAHHVATSEWERELYQDLWKFHPYGIGYEVLDLNQRAYVVARTMFDPTKDGFIQRFGAFVKSWFEAKRIFPVKFVKLYTFEHADKRPGYSFKPLTNEEHSVIAAVNIPWPDSKLPEYAAIEAGEA